MRIADYFVIDHSGISSGEFFNGKNGNEIDVGGNKPWSRPGIELTYQIIDVACNDGQRELLVKGGSGGTAGLYLSTAIYRFDPAAGSMKIIFEKNELVSHYDGKGNTVIDEVNYIGLSYDKNPCGIKVFVCKGMYQEDTVAVLKHAPKTFYYFNEVKNGFEEFK